MIRDGVAEAGVILKLCRQDLDIGLGAEDMVAGLRVTGFRQMRQGAYAHVLDGLVFFHTPGDLGFEIGVLIVEKITGLLQYQMGFDSGQQDRWSDGLGDVIHRAQSQPLLFVCRRLHGSDKNHRYIVGGLIFF